MLHTPKQKQKLGNGIIFHLVKESVVGCTQSKGTINQTKTTKGKRRRHKANKDNMAFIKVK
jgi:hypothetical protein